MGYENARTMGTPEVLNPLNNSSANGDKYAEVILAIVKAIKTTHPSHINKDIVELWKECLHVLNTMKLNLKVEDSAIVAMQAARMVLKELSPQSDNGPTLNT